ncbi:hypothetical protein [Helicobacter rodentium]|uniref:hypothetical protein n=1 Tax=Helicobacter rodentium TaxID=59617 RepID=UPI0012EC6D55|nr:hypothetical protein [Helicobacter rodentium]
MDCFVRFTLSQGQKIKASVTASLREVGTTSWQSIILSINKDSIVKDLIMQDYGLLRRCLARTKHIM